MHLHSKVFNCNLHNLKSLKWYYLMNLKKNQSFYLREFFYNLANEVDFSIIWKHAKCCGRFQSTMLYCYFLGSNHCPQQSYATTDQEEGCWSYKQLVIKHDYLKLIQWIAKTFGHPIPWLAFQFKHEKWLLLTDSWKR